MDATLLIANLVTLERAAGRSGDAATRDFVIQAQDYILQMQRENLELRRENHMLRRRIDLQSVESVNAGAMTAALSQFASRRFPNDGESESRRSQRVELAAAV